MVKMRKQNQYLQKILDLSKNLSGYQVSLPFCLGRHQKNGSHTVKVTWDGSRAESRYATQVLMVPYRH